MKFRTLSMLSNLPLREFLCSQLFLSRERRNCSSVILHCSIQSVILKRFINELLFINTRHARDACFLIWLSWSENSFNHLTIAKFFSADMRKKLVAPLVSTKGTCFKNRNERQSESPENISRGSRIVPLFGKQSFRWLGMYRRNKFICQWVSVNTPWGCSVANDILQIFLCRVTCTICCKWTAGHVC